jgi:hypothetical protein
MHGVEYEGFQRKDRKITYGIKRPSRKMGDKCTSLACRKSTKHFCDTFPDEERKLMFQTFWEKMDWGKKNVVGNIEYTKTQRLSKGEELSRRNGTYWYYLRNKNNEKKPVCKRMFLNTFGLKEGMVHEWFKKTEYGLNTTSGTTTKTKNTGERRSNNRNKIKKDFLNKWFDSLPKMPSHYCRKDTNKLYLETLFQSKA